MSSRPTSRRARRLAVLGLALAVLWPGPVAAEAPSLEALVRELRGIHRSLKSARATFERYERLDKTQASTQLADALLDFTQEAYLPAVMKLTELTSRPAFKRHPGHGEALAYLGESLWRIGLRDSGAARMRDALEGRMTPSLYRQTLTRYLTLAAQNDDLSRLRRYWRRYQGLRLAEELTPEDRELRYQYAKALYRGDALAESQGLFEAIDEADARHLQAKYFVGVIHLRRDDEVKALAAFEDALVAHERATRGDPLEDRWYAEALEAEDGPSAAVDVELIELEEDPEVESATQKLLDPDARSEQRMGELIRLALGRMHAARDETEKAWQHYRHIPPGSPDFATALDEGISVLFHRGRFSDYAWGVRLVDQLLGQRGDDVSAARLTLRKGQLLAQATDYETARRTYDTMEVALRKRGDQLEAELADDDRLFPDPVLAWSAPEDATGARRLEANVVEQEEALAEAMELFEALQGALAKSGRLPAVERAYRLMGELEQKMDALRGRLEQARADRGAYDGKETGEGFGIAQVMRAARRLEGRLKRYRGSVDRYESRFRKRLGQVVREERPQLASHERALAGTRRSVKRLSQAMRLTARTNLETYAAEARFGQVNIAWWRKEEISKRIRDAQKSAKAEMEPHEAAVEQMNRELSQDPTFILREPEWWSPEAEAPPPEAAADDAVESGDPPPPDAAAAPATGGEGEAAPADPPDDGGDGSWGAE